MGKNPDGSIGYPIIGYLVLDTDPASPRIIEGDSTKDFVLKNIALQTSGLREFINCSMSDQQIAYYFRGGPAQNPHIFKWLHPRSRSTGRPAPRLPPAPGRTASWPGWPSSTTARALRINRASAPPWNGTCKGS